MSSQRTYKKFGDLVIFDKRFQGIDSSLQKHILSFAHVSAEELRAMEVPDGTVRLLSTGLYDGYTTEDIAGSNLCEGEVITIPTGGAPNIKYYKGKFVDSGNILCSAKDESVCLKYVHYALLANRPLLERSFRGASIKHPQMADIWKIMIPCPSFSEQQSIVRELDTISDVIAAKNTQLLELDALAEALFYDTFGDFKGVCKWECLDELYKFIDYRGKTPNKIDAGVPLITARNVRFGFLDYSVRDFISAEEYATRQSRGIAHKGDILFTTEAPLGYAAIADLDEFSTGQRIIALQVKNEKKIDNIFALRYILSNDFQQKLLQNATGATAKGIKAEKLKGITIPLPPLDLQQSFAAKIKAIEAQKTTLRQSIAEFESLLAQRMDYHFN